MPCDYSKYPADWKQIRERILKRAKNRCEICGVLNHTRGFRDRHGRFYYMDEAIDITEGVRSDIRDVIFDFGEKPINIVLTIAHLKHGQYEDDTDLLALCQRCHLKMDLRYKLKKIKDRKEKYQVKML